MWEVMCGSEVNIHEIDGRDLVIERGGEGWDSVGSGYGRVAGFCGDGDKPPGSMECMKFLTS
jgi:hypothetical protein